MVVVGGVAALGCQAVSSVCSFGRASASSLLHPIPIIHFEPCHNIVDVGTWAFITLYLYAFPSHIYNPPSAVLPWRKLIARQ
jgi:hypothetical protein